MKNIIFYRLSHVKSYMFNIYLIKKKISYKTMYFLMANVSN